MNKGINLKYNCSKCHESNISYKLYGMPDVASVDELKSFGLSVKIMGCIPPYTGEKTYIFQCENCKHGWFEYDEEEESFFEFLYETYPGPPSPKIVYEGGFIIIKQSEEASYFRMPNDKETELFWEKIDEFDVWSWKKKYSDDNVLDGFSWELLIKKIGKKEKRICGYNSYPRNKKFFKSFIKCIEDFTYWNFEY